MEFEEYQAAAARTDDLPDDTAVLVAFLGIGGEAGSLLTEYKKLLRDGPAHERFTASVTEELGDVLWYVATVANRLHLDLGEIAATNIAKTWDRWGGDEGGASTPLFNVMPDESYPAEEQLPRQLKVRFAEVTEGTRKKVIVTDASGTSVGNELTDNAYDDDGYRFHDAMHLAHMAVLGWSPVLRKSLNRKRRSNSITDEIEDGGRAAVIEEAVVAFVYAYAKEHAYLEGVRKLDYQLLRTVKLLTSGLEVARWTLRDWESAILQGFDAWRSLLRDRHGVVVCDMKARTIRRE